jgi:hypothetical protein
MKAPENDDTMPGKKGTGKDGKSQTPGTEKVSELISGLITQFPCGIPWPKVTRHLPQKKIIQFDPDENY